MSTLNEELDELKDWIEFAEHSVQHNDDPFVALNEIVDVAKKIHAILEEMKP